MDWAGIWNDIVDFFSNNVWNIVLFFVILFVGIVAIKLFLNLLKRVLGKTKMEKIAQQFICTIIKFVLWLALILLLLTQIGVDISGLIAACSAIVLAVGLALQNCISNVANGIIIISNKMFKKNDYIITDNVEGKITNINFLFTTLLTSDNKKITLPNSIIINNEVTNLGAMPTRRVDFTFSVAYETDVEVVKKIVTDVMKSDGRVYLDPAPFCRLKYLSASSIDFAANCWVDNEDYWDVYYYVIENVYNELKRNNISIPYSQLEIRERKDTVVMPVIKTKLPARVEKVRNTEHKFDLENDDLTSILKIKRKQKNKTKKSNKKQKEGEQKNNNLQQIDNQAQNNLPKIDENINVNIAEEETKNNKNDLQTNTDKNNK